MFQPVARIFGFLAVILVASVALAQTEFSAEIVDLEKPGTTAAKLYFGKDKLRIESQNSGARSGGALIMNLATQTSTVLMPQQHMYMDMPAQSKAQRLGYTFFQTGDVENACSDWLKLASNKGGSCHKIGDESVNGRDTVKYESTNANGETNQFWLDPKLRFPIKWQGKNNGELQNIKEGSQPSSLFEVPAGFTKMEIPAGMMQQSH